ncbi:ATP-binding protein [Patescibacteria group bacterium]|nr:ATP-binding protein [Patescibacteria group bacterium]MBU1663290.1 ATP-binding protein [Patescibacteria group bacterium]MBU1934004.1 ATP-binding protein [Patescibacteria group bacterium]MBU2008138.1 ATP-binding protein [Patescibacteria group bacterium]MBU2233673.1 ATP-binding protein [Patescibacteria group bacterium]
MQGKNKPLLRCLEKEIKKTLSHKRSCLILGPRQVGKTTLVKTILSKFKNVIEYPLQNPSIKLEIEADPSKIIRQVEAVGNRPIVFVDEAQKIPEIFDAAQYLIDENKATFIFTGSSARKLKRGNVNLLPGRIRHFHMNPLLWSELGYSQNNTIKKLSLNNIDQNSSYNFIDSLVYGSLPALTMILKNERENYLRSYSEMYLEEEIRAEAISRKIGAFSRFLELAAAESGTAPNLCKLSQESGVSQPAIKEFYRILEDTLIVERVDPYLKNSRKRILSSARYYFFDLGVRNALARLPLTKKLINAQKGILFEHAVVLEIIKRIRALNKNYKVYYWRTSGGAEVDCVLDLMGQIIPIEIKASKNISLSDIKGLKFFLEDYKKVAKYGYVITMGEKKEKLAENIIAIPWFLF